MSQLGKFIRESLLFVGLLVAGVGVIPAVRTLLHEPYRVDESVTTVITGDSHVQIAINDGSMGETRNIALFSEPYIYSYYKLKEILEHNHNIEKVILGFGRRPPRIE